MTIDRARIKVEADSFFEWPTADRSSVTTTSMLLFAERIAEIVRRDAGAVLPIEIGCTALEVRSKEIKLRRLEIAATLAEWKRAYLVEGVERPRGDRAILEAEDANLALEGRRIGEHVNVAVIERQRKIKDQLLGQLLALLEERGLADIVAEAKRRAAAEDQSAEQAQGGAA